MVDEYKNADFIQEISDYIFLDSRRYDAKQGE